MLRILSFAAAIAILAIPVMQADARSGGVRSTGAANVGSMRSVGAPRSSTSAPSVSRTVKPLQTTPALIPKVVLPAVGGSSKDSAR